jgi:hypothetical protein
VPNYGEKERAFLKSYPVLGLEMALEQGEIKY